MNKLFISSGFVEDGVLANARGETLCMRSLPRFLRVLLTTDGTVTKSIESYFWEPVNVINLGQSYVHLGHPADFINKVAGDKVLERCVELVGERSGKQFAHARSLICTQYLGEQLRADLEAGRVGIGELLRECGLETYREIMQIGYTDQDHCFATEDKLIWRTYRIVMDRHPLIQITESFPLAAYQ